MSNFHRVSAHFDLLRCLRTSRTVDKLNHHRPTKYFSQSSSISNVAVLREMYLQTYTIQWQAARGKLTHLTD